MHPQARSCIASALLGVVAILSARAQVFDLERDRVQMAELHGFWRFHTGDDPDGKLGWADPGFDDSSWKLLHSDQPLNVQGYPGFSGMAWYRFQVVLPANHSPLALYIPEIGTSYQVFAGGRLIGQVGGLPRTRESISGTLADSRVRPLLLGAVSIKQAQGFPVRDGLILRLKLLAPKLRASWGNSSRTNGRKSPLSI